MTEIKFHKLPECLLCQYYTCNLNLLCAVHPSGVERASCPDYAPVVYRGSTLHQNPVSKELKP